MDEVAGLRMFVFALVSFALFWRIWDTTPAIRGYQTYKAMLAMAIISIVSMLFSYLLKKANKDAFSTLFKTLGMLALVVFAVLAIVQLAQHKDSMYPYELSIPMVILAGLATMAK